MRGASGINFAVAATDNPGMDPWFIVGKSAFESAVIVRSAPIKPVLTIRTGSVDITVTPDDSSVL